MLQLPLSIQLDDSARFDNFFVGDNSLLLDKLTSLHRKQEQLVYFWGAQASGKTHLAQAICHHFNELAATAVYLPLDNAQLAPEVLDGMHAMDIICLDNIQSIAGDRPWEIALFNLYNEIKQRHGLLVISGDCPPADIAIGLADLRSRLAAMEIYKLAGLSDAHRVAFLQARASSRGLVLSSDVAEFVLSRFGRSVDEMIANLDRLDHASMVLKRKITIPLVKQILERDNQIVAGPQTEVK